MNIRNIVFDFGQVLVRFDPAYMVGRFVSDPEDAELLESVVFDRLYWDKLDAGTITDEETLVACRERLPKRLWKVAERIYKNWIYNIPEIAGMAELITRIRKIYPVRLFVLSNISAYFAVHEGEIPILRLFEKRIYSAVCGMVKPSREIFEHLCKECHILPSETLFVDDNVKNIKGAESCGISGYLFDGNVARLEEYLKQIL